MRTWKQGAIGMVSLPDSRPVYIKCLKYPLGRFFGHYDSEADSLQRELFVAFVQLSVLKCIERIGFEKLTKEEREVGDVFEMGDEGGLYDIEKIQERCEAVGL